MKKTRQVFVVMLFSPTKAGQSAQIMLPRELTNFQNVIVIKKGLMLPLHKAAMHHINMKNQKVPYRLLYNLFFYELKILCKYLDDALVKD